MKTMVLITTLAAAALARAGDGNTDAVEASAVMEHARTQMAAAQEQAQAQMAAAQAQMAAARKQLQAASKELAEAALIRHVTGYKRAFLGVLLGDQSEDGIVVAGVTPGGGAETAGIQANDIIVAVNDESLTGHEQPLEVLHRVLDGISPGGDVAVVVMRDGETQSFDAVPTSTIPFTWGFHPNPSIPIIERFQGIFDGARGSTDGTIEIGGLQFVDIGEDLGDYFGVDSGVLVLNAPGDSELKPGDIVGRIDGADVASANEARRLLAATSGDDAEVEVRRKNRKVEITAAKMSPLIRQTVRTLPSAVPGTETVIVSGSVPLEQIEVEVEVEKGD